MSNVSANDKNRTNKNDFILCSCFCCLIFFHFHVTDIINTVKMNILMTIYSVEEIHK